MEKATILNGNANDKSRGVQLTEPSCLQRVPRGRLTDYNFPFSGCLESFGKTGKTRKAAPIFSDRKSIMPTTKLCVYLNYSEQRGLRRKKSVGPDQTSHINRYDSAFSQVLG